MKNLYGFWAGIAAVLLAIIFYFQPYWCEASYGDVIFPFIRWTLDYSLNRLPISLLGILSGVFLFVLIFRGVLLLIVRSKKRLISFLNAIGWIISFFYIIWGYNYFRPKSYDPEIVEKFEVSDTLINSELERVVGLAKEIRLTFPTHLLLEDRQVFNYFLDSKILWESGIVQSNYLYSSKYYEIYPKGFLGSLGISGIYFPFTGQSNIESALLNFEKPFIIAHELFHSYGITQEAECNYYAYKSCVSNNDPFIVYSGYINYISYLLFELRQKDSPFLKIWMDELPNQIQFDLLAIKKNNQMYISALSKLASVSNDWYLRINGVNEGANNYNLFVKLVLLDQIKKKKS